MEEVAAAAAAAGSFEELDFVLAFAPASEAAAAS